MTDTSELQKLLGAATPGPWSARQDGTREMSNITAFIVGDDDLSLVTYGHLTFEDRDLIVAAVNAMPEYIEQQATIARLTAERDDARRLALEEAAAICDQAAADEEATLEMLPAGSWTYHECRAARRAARSMATRIRLRARALVRDGGGE